MTASELKKITSDFSDIKPLIDERNKLLRQTNKVRRRLKTRLEKYDFLKDMIGIGSHSTKLVNSIVKYFKTLGFEKIENVDKSKDEDIRLWVDDKLIIFEVTGIPEPTTKDAKAHQISKHIQIRQEEYPGITVSGVFIVNHDNKKHYSIRHKSPFRKGLNEIARTNKYTLTTTIDLFNAFIKIKNGKLTKEELINKICSTGELKILGS